MARIEQRTVSANAGEERKFGIIIDNLKCKLMNEVFAWKVVAGIRDSLSFLLII